MTCLNGDWVVEFRSGSYLHELSEVEGHGTPLWMAQRFDTEAEAKKASEGWMLAGAMPLSRPGVRDYEAWGKRSVGCWVLLKSQARVTELEAEVARLRRGKLTAIEKEMALRFLKARFDESKGMDKLWDKMMRSVISLVRSSK